MTPNDPRTPLERTLTAMMSSATTCEVHPDAHRAPDRSPRACESPNWTVRPYLCAREIRVGWSEGLLAIDGVPSTGGLWHLDTECNRLLLMVTVAEGQRLFGPASHWLEERDA